MNLYVKTISLRIDPLFARASIPGQTDVVKDLAMESSDLFSHPHQPEAVNREAFTEPVQAPVFSDRPQDTTPDTPPIS